MFAQPAEQYCKQQGTSDGQARSKHEAAKVARALRLEAEMCSGLPDRFLHRLHTMPVPAVVHLATLSKERSNTCDVKDSCDEEGAPYPLARRALEASRELFSMGRDMAAGRYKGSMLTIIALVAGVLYILSPIDLIPDFIPVIGWVDDGFVFVFLLKRIMYELDRYAASKSRALKVIRK